MDRPPPSPDGPRLTRRVAMAGPLAALPAVPLAGCAAPAAPASGEDPDATLLADAASRVAAAAQLVAATAGAHPALATTLGALTDLHATHLALLGELGGQPQAEPSPSTVEPTTVPRRQRRALVVVRRTEAELADRLRECSVLAQDGPLARALASMAAGVAQQIEVLAEGRAA